jgi:hypothetical protein
MALSVEIVNAKRGAISERLGEFAEDGKPALK